MTLALFVFNWPSLFLVCFIVGFVLALLSVMSGLLELHLPGNLGHVFHLHVHPHVPHVHVPHGHVHVNGPHAHAGHGGSDISPINFPTIMAFLAWFGGAGYLLTSVYGMWYLTALFFASLAGLIGASIVFWFFVKVMMGSERPMDPTEFRVVGAVGTLTLGIREGGTGELVYVQGGARKTSAARSEDGSAIPKGTEVAVTSFERGVAYVRRWEELADEPFAMGSPKPRQ
jgi:membrane protein implicated in regulation of membrane protease activity